MCINRLKALSLGGMSTFMTHVQLNTFCPYITLSYVNNSTAVWRGDPKKYTILQEKGPKQGASSATMLVFLQALKTAKCPEGTKSTFTGL